MRFKKFIIRLLSGILRSNKRQGDEHTLESEELSEGSNKIKFFSTKRFSIVFRRRHSPRYRKFESEAAKKSVRFANLKPEDKNTPPMNKANKRKQKKRRKKTKKGHKRFRFLRREAKKAVEYLAAGVAISGVGYGLPPGFNPNAFRTECEEYPEVYTVEQLRWMADYKKNFTPWAIYLSADAIVQFYRLKKKNSSD